MTKESLILDQPVWIESSFMFFGGERAIHEHKIVEVNNSSAYAIALEDLEKYKEDPKRLSYCRKRIVQRTHEIKGDGFGTTYHLWLTPEAFERSVQYGIDKKAAFAAATKKLSTLNLSELKEFLGPDYKE